MPNAHFKMHAGLTCIENVLSGAVPLSVSARKTTWLSCHLGPPPFARQRHIPSTSSTITSNDVLVLELVRPGSAMRGIADGWPILLLCLS